MSTTEHEDAWLPGTVYCFRSSVQQDDHLETIELLQAIVAFELRRGPITLQLEVRPAMSTTEPARENDGEKTYHWQRWVGDEEGASGSKYEMFEAIHRGEVWTVHYDANTGSYCYLVVRKPPGAQADLTD